MSWRDWILMPVAFAIVVCVCFPYAVWCWLDSKEEE